MVTNRHIDKIVAVIVALAVVGCLLAMTFSSELETYAGGLGVKMEYERKLFDSSAPITVSISVDEDDWQDMLKTASAEVYYKCDVTVAGQTFREVGIRPKGNTSLSAIASNPDTDRYSFKLEFDHYVDGQSCFGLDKLALNNNYADATNMKEALIYDMYRYIGADASLCNYAVVYVNGEYWGVYLALEAVEDSFLLRNYGVNSGELYKPESMNMGGRNKNSDPGAGGFNFGGPGGFSMGGNGANLNYSDDDLDGYSAIWEGEVTKSKKADHRRVVEALKNISEGIDLDRYMDVENLLRYMAVHVFSVNSDSLTGNMAHNYYLYEKDGRLNLLPWDYNLSLGGMGGGGNASATINDAIDGAFSGTRFFDKLMENESCYNAYHDYLRQLVDEYVEGGGFDEFYTRTRALLDEYVATDPTAFYSFEEYSDAADTLYQVVKLRGQSISSQLDGRIPSTESGQRADSSNLVDTGDLDLSIMGTMDMGNGAMGGGGGFKGFGGGFNFGGGGFGGKDFDPSKFGGERPNGGKPKMESSQNAGLTALAQTDSGYSAVTLANVGGRPSGGMPGGFGSSQGGNPPQFGGSAPGGFDPSQAGDLPQFGGERPGNFDPSQFGGEAPEGFDPSQAGEPPQFGGKPEDADLPASGGGSMGDVVPLKAEDAPATPAPPTVSDAPSDATPAPSDAPTDAPTASPVEEDAPADADNAPTPDDLPAPPDDAAESGFPFGQMPGGDGAPNFPSGGDSSDRPDRGNMNFGGFPGAGASSDGLSTATKNLITYGVCFAILLAALAFATLFRRRSRRR